MDVREAIARFRYTDEKEVPKGYEKLKKRIESDMDALAAAE